MANDRGVAVDAQVLLMGHRPKDVRSLFYQAENLPNLAAEIAKFPELPEIRFPLDPDALETPDAPTLQAPISLQNRRRSGSINRRSWSRFGHQFGHQTSGDQNPKPSR
jgi:hypothetical protein